MNKKTTAFALALICLMATMILIGFTAPSIDSGWLIVLFFIFLFGFILFGLRSVGHYLGYNSKQLSKVVFIATCIIVSAQILITFQALRPVELLLISSVLGSVGWYVSRAKS